MSSKKRTNQIYSRAYQLAATGQHLEPITIISALIREGWVDAAEVLQSPLVRDDLRRVCARRWPGEPRSPPEEPPPRPPGSAGPVRPRS